MLPVGLKNQILPILSEGFVLKNHVSNDCLELYPRKEWDTTMERIKKRLNRNNPRHTRFLRKFLSGVRLIDLDNTGRLLIPKDLQAGSGITKDVVLMCVFGTIEIWDKSRFAAETGDSDIEQESAELLGDIDDDDDDLLS
jgi:MraZ protein